MKRLILASLTAILMTPGIAAAQFMLAPQGSWGSDSDFGIGARVTYGLAATESTNLELVGSFDYFFPSTDGGADVTYWEINGNVNYVLPVRSEYVRTYLGAGLNVAYASVDLGSVSPGLSGSETEIGLNLLAGVHGTSRINPFGEVRFIIAGGEQFVFTAGVNFTLGGS